ncbi:YceD family protein [Pontibaca salina]|uniref:DUF177 domain-containing protein n=1 Tax=Pontibaca salina TaxID=2795731 RepID=A0A934HMS3_9RHOB|nr:DUF177 domain-containing protein [Pontibaca salina]MBI6629806.1 DUF177 domain-containing protein [Pontibaca salina]
MPHKTALLVVNLDGNTPTPFDLRPDAAQRDALARELGLSGLRKLRFSGEIKAQGSRDWVLLGRLGATVIQPCVATLEPVTTRIDTDVRRTYLADLPEPEGEEVEMPEDETQERLGSHIDPHTVMAEALALAAPLYPRAKGVDLGEAVFAEPGVEPLRDRDLKPFAGLAELRDALKNGT